MNRPSRPLHSTISLALIALLTTALARAPLRADESLDSLVELIADLDDDELRLDLLRGLREGLRGRRDLELPKDWKRAYTSLRKSASEAVREESLAIALAFGDPSAVGELRVIALDTGASPERRVRALETLVEHRAEGLAKDLLALLDDATLARTALRGLAAAGDPAVPEAILSRWVRLDVASRADALTTLASRPAWALALLAATEKGLVDRRDIPAFAARGLDALGDEQVSERLREVWGEVRKSSAETKALLEKYRAALGADALAKADVARGRELFTKTCAQCHRLFGEGGTLAPDLTGSNRTSLDYVLENVLDPNAMVGKGYLLSNAVLQSGRVVSGILAEEDSVRVVLRTVNEDVTLSRSEIVSLSTSEISMMPEGLLEKLALDEVRDLVGYLATPAPPPAAGASPSGASGESTLLPRS